jgi:hypothetical protein
MKIGKNKITRSRWREDKLNKKTSGLLVRGGKGRSSSSEKRYP